MKKQQNQRLAIQDTRLKMYTQVRSTLTDSKQLLNRLNLIKQKMMNTVHTVHLPTQTNIANDVKTFNSPQMQPFQTKNFLLETQEKQKQKIDTIRQNIIGLCSPFTSPYGIQLQAVYVDHTATSRPYRLIENMVNYAKKYVANPHTQYSHFGDFSTQMMNNAHESLLKSFSADPDKYVVLPVGSGSTGAVQKAMKIMQSLQGKQSKPAVFITPYEHHSNILPWVQFYGDVTTLHVDQNNILVMKQIQEQLRNCKKQQIIVSVSGTSNVTSQVTDLRNMNETIKKVRKFKKIIYAIDGAAFCCHHQLNLKILDQVDFAYLSPHKNLGGTESCGLLLARKSLISHSTPSFPGGGTVSFVSGYHKEDVFYDVDPFNRQVAGTPPFLGFYRAALSFDLLKNQIGYEFIHERQTYNSKTFVGHLLGHIRKFKQQGLKHTIVIYGTCALQKRANVFTINIVNNGEVMHHHLVSLILTDVFGIQLRSGCFCAGPFAVVLRKFDQKMIQNFKGAVQLGYLKDKPGYLRLDLTFYLEQFEIQYIAQAIGLITRHCRNLEKYYTLGNDGLVKRNFDFNNDLQDIFYMRSEKTITNKLQKLEFQDRKRLQNRKITLQNQLKQGQNFIKNPDQYLKLKKIKK